MGDFFIARFPEGPLLLIYILLKICQNDVFKKDYIILKYYG